MKNILKISATLSVLACAIITNYVHAQSGPFQGSGWDYVKIRCKCSTTETKGCFANGEKGYCHDGDVCSSASANCK